MKNDQPKLTLKWGLTWAFFSLAAAIAINETILPGKGMSVGFGILATAIISRMIIGKSRSIIYIPYILFVFAAHLILIFISPSDDKYPGGLMYPLGMIDVGIFYLIFLWIRGIFERKIKD